jgi:small-conductance mechanosensitive channel
MNWKTLLFDTPFVTRLLSTLVLIGITLVVRNMLLRRWALRQDVDATTRRRWIVSTRNTMFLVILGIVVVIWLEQLRAVAATVVVIAAAIVVATKEFLLNIIGYIFQSTTKFVTVGDRIEVDGIRGDVIDQDMLGMTLMEIGSGEKTNQYTGLTVFVPNAKLLSATVKNETRLWGDYVFHLITIPIERQDKWQLAEQALLDAANEVCRPYLEMARQSMASLSHHHSLEAPSVDPRVNLQVASSDKINLILRMPVPTRRRGRLEQEVTRRYLKILEELTPPDPAAPVDGEPSANGPSNFANR